MSLDENTITFGKYKDLTLTQLLKDRSYCAWLLKQEWFPKQYEYLYNRVKEHNPRQFFHTKERYTIAPCSNSLEKFLQEYEYFFLVPLEELKIELNETEKKCYSFYLDTIKTLKEKLEKNADDNPYNIKAPSSWLKKFESSTELSRDVFKEFLATYDLPNIPYIVEDIKKMGGIDYKGAKSFKIAKEKSLTQEKFWEDILKKYYGEDVGVQYKYKKCIFDFIRISANTLYECKLGLKDFDEAQHAKYKATLGEFCLVYLISTDCIVDISEEVIYTTDYYSYSTYLLNVPGMKKPSKFDNLIQKFTVKEIKTLDEYFNGSAIAI